MFLTACNNSNPATTNSLSAATPIASQSANLSPSKAIGNFREYDLPQAKSGLMRPAIDHEGRIWFGEMNQNYLASFDPSTQMFQQIRPPRAAFGIMTVAIAPDDTVWFSEQYANYIGHYFPDTHQFQTYDLPILKTPDPSDNKNTLTLPSAPNDIAFDAHGNVWFAEMNADALGMLDIKTGQVKHYQLSPQKSIQALAPYGITIDPQGMVWFTEANTNKLGRLDPRTGAIRLYTLSGPNDPLMEVASDTHSMIWATTFNQTILLRFDPVKETFTPYHAPSSGHGEGGMYGLVIAPDGNIWLAATSENSIARFDVATQRFTSYQIPTQGSVPFGIVMAKDHTLWFTESSGNKIGMLQP